MAAAESLHFIPVIKLTPYSIGNFRTTQELGESTAIAYLITLVNE